MSLTAWQTTRDTNFLGSYDLCVGADTKDQPIYRDMVLTIQNVETDAEVLDPKTSKKIKKSVVYFEENVKPMILNTTNKKGISTATGTIFIEKWVGKKINVVVEQVKAFGIVQPALRVKPIPKRKCDVCGKEITEEIYQMAMDKFSMALCGKECGIKAGKIKVEERTQ